MSKRTFIVVILIATVVFTALSFCRKKAPGVVKKAEELFEKRDYRDAYFKAKRVVEKCPGIIHGYRSMSKSFIKWGYSASSYEISEWYSEAEDYTDLIIENMAEIRGDEDLYIGSIQIIYFADAEYCEMFGEHIVKPIGEIIREELEYWGSMGDRSQIRPLVELMLDSIDDAAELKPIREWVEENSSDDYARAVADTMETIATNLAREAEISAAKMILKRIWEAEIMHYEENGRYTEPAEDIFGSGRVPVTLVLDEYDNQSFTYDILEGGAVRATPNPSVAPMLEDVSPIHIDPEGNIFSAD